MTAWERLAPPDLRDAAPMARVAWTLFSLFVTALVVLLVIVAGAATVGCSTPVAPAACGVIDLADNVCDLIVTVRDPKTGAVVRVRYPAQDIRAAAAASASTLPRANQ